MNILKNHFKAKAVRNLTACCFILFAMVGNTMAQSDKQYVIKSGDHFLAHVNNGNGWVLQDATTFSPNCVWYSGNTVDVTGDQHNYYFLDGNTYHFLSAPLQAEGALSLSDGLPPVSILRNSDQIYYFYNWDQGLARGHQYPGVSQQQCTHVWGAGQCWDVFWVGLEESNTWKLSINHYEPLANSGHFHQVTVSEHPMELTPVSGGLDNLSLQLTEMTQGQSQGLSASVSFPYSYSYIPAYTKYTFDGIDHYYYGGEDHTIAPGTELGNPTSVTSYQWTLSGEGAEFLSINDATSANPTLTYSTQNTTGHKTATITVTVTYNDETTQTSSATVLVMTDCHNPAQASAPVVTFEGVIVSWYPTAESYVVSWKKANASEWNTTTVYNVTSYTITGLEYATPYIYTVSAVCGGTVQPNPTEYGFTTKEQPGLLVYGSIFGGGRMADVGGKTEVAIINCDSIHAVYGGNDIAGAVLGADGSNVTLGVNTGGTYASYGTTNGPIRIGDVYGGGNGYYAYKGNSFEAASSDYRSQEVAVGDSVSIMTQLNQVGESAWTNNTGSPVTWSFPSITKTTVTVTNDYIKVDSIFGGAKNAFLTTNEGNGSTVTINGGTIFAVFGGNNIGGGQGYGKHRIDVTKTTTHVTVDDTYRNKHGRDFGIGYLFGGGNKVTGSTTDIYITGGQIDTIFGGGNLASVYAANINFNCALAAGTGNNTFGNVYSQAISSYANETISINGSYAWNRSGMYNVRTLFGGNNMAAMSCVPNITLTSGSIGTVYGGGNQGDMLAQATDDGNSGTLNINGEDVKYGTHVEMNSDKVLVDYLYGGCQRSNVEYSTWTEIKKGHVGTVYGGCNISGDVGSTRINPDAPSSSPATAEYQAVQGGTFVVASGGIVYTRLFAGSNGYYHCNDGISYVNDDQNPHNFSAPENYVGLPIPTHNETHAVVTNGAVIKGDVYAGGNMSPVGFTDATYGGRPYPLFVGWSSIQMDGGRVEGSVYAGGNMASIYGSNEARISGGTILGALYGGNDRSGQAGQISNRLMANNKASDNITSLTDLEVHSYVKVTGTPEINTVYGGGNGDYTYTTEQYCDVTDLPIQSHTFVDINIDGSSDGGHIQTVYGGGNGVTVTGGITVFLNVVNSDYSRNHVDTIFGGNNKDNIVDSGDTPLVPDIILLHGQVKTVYGGSNRGAMASGKDFVFGGVTYENVGSMVRLRSSYDGDGEGGEDPVVPTAVVSEAVYGGCRLNSVNKNTLVLVEAGDHSNATFFGGSDVSGVVKGVSQVVVTGGSIKEAYGGGNGNYNYNEGEYQGLAVPYCKESLVSMSGGSADNLYAGGYAGPCGVTDLTMSGGSVSGSIFGGGKEAGVLTTHNVNNLDNSVTVYNTSGNSTVTMNGGSVLTGVYGGCHNSGAIKGNILVNVNQGTVGTSDIKANIHGGGYGQLTTSDGNVTVNIGSATATSWANVPLIYGDIYGGSAFGSVNSTEETRKTMVNFLNGTLHGDLYGGGLGQQQNGENPAIEAKVYGQVEVNISNDTQLAENCFIDLRGANVYGCNNANGSPQDEVTVHVWKTAFNYSDYTTGNNYTSQLGTNGTGAVYAIDQVFGGGNHADYRPVATGNANTEHKTNVYIHDCSNTIRRVFGGGNAAYAQGVTLTIDGGRMNYVFGGGNGEEQAANIGAGGTNTLVSAGIINHLFGVSNFAGSIAGPVNTVVNGAHYIPNGANVTNPCDENILEFFGGGNLADLSANINSVVSCGCGLIGTVYGGCNLSNLEGDVNLTIGGGNLEAVYGGSKGDNDTAATITGNITLNLEGGTIGNAFGGSNIKGNITGAITVNVRDREECPLDVTNIYGASNLTPYTPTNSAAQSPVINVIHIAQTNGVRGNVYGGGNEALVTAHPKVYIGYDANTMSNLLPSDYPAPEDLTNFPHAYVTGKVFGGGNKAGVSSTEVNILGGTVVTAVHGGCNEQGAVGGNAIVNVVSGTIGAEGGTAGDVFGGGYGQPTTVAGDVNVTIGTENGATTTPYIYGTIYGGSALGSVNTNTDNLTKVWLRSGTVGERVYGGGLGQKNGVDGATSDIAALVNGDIQVIDDGTDVNTCIYGGNDKNGDPAGTIEVTVNAGTIGNVVGGGNLAAYTAPSGSLDYPYVYIHGGTVTNKVVGGGNAASITGNPRVVIDGGTIGTDSDATTGLGKGIYGGCNASGTVTGNTSVTLTGGTIGVSTTNKANIHGGGYGEPTNVTGNVLVNFGADDDTQALEFPKLFGDLYGGSALGNVNTNDSNTTTVNLRNGTINGAAYGGGLGDKASLGTGHSDVPAKVFGKVYVNVGSASDPDDVDTYKGQATLVDCDIYGCNNLNGSPQDNVYLNVFKTAHIPTNIAGYVEDDRTYAIDEVFGGGNQADFTPTGKKTYVHIHKCENTVRRLFGGGNAAYVPGIDLTIDGGRLFWVFGGGNGELGAAYAANIGAGGIFIHLGGGRIDLLVNGSNEHGDVLEGGSVTLESFDGCENSVVIDHFMGANQTTIYGNITETIECGTDKRFVNLYCGSNLAQIYGNINLTIEGGVFENVFGGSKGSLNNTSNPQGFQTYASSIHDNPYTTDVLEGHVNLLIKGGTIGNIYGACDVNGNVDGKVTITVNRDESSSCDPLFFIGNIYGGGNHTDYTPINIGDGNSYSPEVIILKGVIGGDSPKDTQNHPLLPIINPNYIIPAAHYEGNIFGGGNMGNVTGNPRIIIGEKTNSNKVIIEGNVFGGGNEGNVTGSPEVIIVPTE